MDPANIISLIFFGFIIILLACLYFIYRLGKKKTKKNSSSPRVEIHETSSPSPVSTPRYAVSKSNDQKKSMSSESRGDTTVLSTDSVTVVEINDSGTGGGNESGVTGECIPEAVGNGGGCDSGTGGNDSGGAGGHSSSSYSCTGGGHSSGGDGGYSYSGGGGGCDSGGGGGYDSGGGGGCDSGGGGGSYD